jgi:hypothetical protein
MLPNTITVKVTQEHIANGAPLSSMDCPIARAISDQLMTDRVTVEYDHAIVEGKRYLASRNAMRFISDFDLGRPVKPQNFRFRGR